MRKDVWTILSRITIVTAFAMLLVYGTNQAYDQYSLGNDDGNCATCHGDFRGNGYVSLSDGETWSSAPHNVHRFTMLNGDCNTCHGASNFPVNPGASTGGIGLPAWGCAGCHGRAEDGTNPGTSEGFGAGLRQHHWNADADHPTMDLTVCANCHNDADPANYTPVGEEVVPPYYSASDASHPEMPSDPCNPDPDFTENFEGTTIGLDNDGNGVYDTADTACGVAVVGPGETSSPGLGLMVVTAHDSGAGNLTLRYNPACGTTDHTLEFGLLGQVSSYDYSGQLCNLGGSAGDATATAVWSYITESAFFLVVGNDGSIEGSYGLDSNGTERPDDIVNTVCPLTQDLTNRCD